MSDHRNGNRLLFVAAGAAIVGLTCAIAALLGPARIDRSHVVWRPSRDGLHRVLPLLGSYPQRLSITTGCSAVRGLAEVAVLVKTAAAPTLVGGLALVSDGHAARLELGSDDRPLSLVVPRSGPCTVRAGFAAHGDRGRLSLRVGDRAVARITTHRVDPVIGVDTSWPRVVSLSADPTLRNDPRTVVRLETTPAGSSPTAGQRIAMLVAVLALGIAGWALARSPRFRSPRSAAPRDRQGRSPIATVSDLAIVGFTAAAVVFTPPFWDDGWVRATITSYPTLGWFSNYYTQADFAQPLGYWWAWLTHAWSGEVGGLVALRLAPALLIISTWWFVRRWVLDAVVAEPHRRLVRAVAASMYALGAAAYLMTLRPEPTIALLVALTLVAVLHFARNPGLRPLLALAALAALAVSAHQSGFVVVATGLAVVPSVVRWARATDHWVRVGSVLVVGTFGAGLATLLIGLDTDLSLVRSGLASFRAGGDYRYGVVDMAIKRFAALDQIPGLQRAWPLLAVLAAGAFLFVGRWIKNDLARLAGYAAAASFLGLLLPGSARPWHFGALVPSTAVLAALAMTGILAMERARRAALVGLGLGVSLVLAWAMRSTAFWAVGDLAERSWADLPHFPAWAWVIIIALGALTGGVAVVRHRDREQAMRGAVAGAAIAALCTPVALTWGLLAIDAADSPAWSYARQAVKELARRDDCGVAGTLPVVTEVSALPQVEIDESPLPIATPEATNPFVIESTVRPFGLPVWGTAPALSARPPADRRVATPWFNVQGLREVVFWTSGNTGPPNRVRAEVLVEHPAGRQRIIRLDPEPTMDTRWWAFHRVQPLPARAAALRIVMIAPSNASAVATTAPASPTFASFSDTTPGAAVWRNPNLVLAMPCRRLPAARGGVVEPFRWSLGPPGYNGAAIATEHPTIERGCLFPQRDGTTPDNRFCAVEFVP